MAYLFSDEVIAPMLMYKNIEVAFDNTLQKSAEMHFHRNLKAVELIANRKKHWYRRSKCYAVFSFQIKLFAVGILAVVLKAWALFNTHTPHPTIWEEILAKVNKFLNWSFLQMCGIAELLGPLETIHLKFNTRCFNVHPRRLGILILWSMNSSEYYMK